MQTRTYNPGTPTTTYALPDGKVMMPSFRGEKVAYVIDLAANTCSCPDFAHRHAGKGTDCKHLKAARAEKFAALAETARQQTIETLERVLPIYEAAGRFDVCVAVLGELVDRRQQVGA